MRLVESFKNFKLLLEANNSLKLNIPTDILELHKLFKQNGKELFIVGGAVRDALLGKKPKDFDLATDAFPNEVIDIVTSAGYTTTGEVGHQFGVVIVNVPSDPAGVEIATFREDIGKGRRPDAVEYSTIDKDVLRRDLTINALFYDMSTKEIVDLVGGLEDIKNSKIRTVGVAADRFAEDPLRKLRALRFAGRTGSKLEKETADAILTDNSLEGISSERIRDEFKKSIVSAKSAKKYLEMVSEFKLWNIMFPTLPISEKFINTNNWLIQLTHLFMANDIDVLKKEMNKATFSNDEISGVIFLKALMSFDPANVFDLHKQFSNSGLDKKVILEFTKINRLDSKMIKAFFKYKPSTNGKDVMKEFGVKGPDIALKINQIEAEKFKSLI
jgi:tRNA nucleotidyltransferase/poly(A) polymerase|tara:strand:+ start:1659 stop:2816 length:1158 start_codon:yes stop_codon:yes gene_type:complete